MKPGRILSSPIAPPGVWSEGFFPILVLLLVVSPAPELGAQGFDLVITHGHIIDGTGSPWYSGDIGIRAGKISTLGNLAQAPRRRTIDAQGKVVLSHEELSLLLGGIDLAKTKHKRWYRKDLPERHAAA